jgi:hypothetical protein
MRSRLSGLVLVGLFASAISAQADPFDGTWKLNLAKSKGAGLPKEEVVVIKITNGAQYKSGVVTEKDGKVHKSDYTATYNDGKWYPTKDMDTGKEGNPTKMIRVDERMEIRLMRPSGDAPMRSFLTRTISPDGKTMTVTSVSLEGTVGTVWVFEKQ